MKKISWYSILTITMMSILMLGTWYMAARVYATWYMADQSVATILSTIESGADRPFDNRARLSGIARIEYYKDLRDIFRQVIARLDQNIWGDNGATWTVWNTRIEGLVVNTGIPVTTTNSSFTGNSATTTTNSSVAGNSATSRNTSNTATNNNNTSSSVTGTTATTWTTTTVARDYSQRARCADRFNQPEYTQDGRVYVGDQLNDLWGMQIGGTTYNYNPSMLCGHLSSLQYEAIQTM